MKRLAVFGIVILLLAIVAGFSQTAINPEDFSGYWYSCHDQSAYLFQEGLIYCPKERQSLPDTESICGAYAYCSDAIFLFCTGVEGMEIEKELYLIHSGDGSFLCENKNGSGKLYFARYHEK